MTNKMALHFRPSSLFSFRPLDISKPDKCHEIDAIVKKYIYFSNARSKNDPYEGAFRELDNSFRLDIKKIIRKTYFSSMSLSPLSVPMWAHYARGHEGICICYNPNAIMDGLSNSNPGESYSLSPVIYRDKKPVIGLDFWKNSAAGLAAFHVLSVKRDEWEYEKEWRVFSSKSGENKYENDPIISIIFGSRWTDKEISKFDEITYRRFRGRLEKMDFRRGVRFKKISVNS